MSNQTFKEFLLEKYSKDSKKKRKKKKKDDCNSKRKKVEKVEVDNTHGELVDFLNQSTITNS